MLPWTENGSSGVNQLTLLEFGTRTRKTHLKTIGNALLRCSRATSYLKVLLSFSSTLQQPSLAWRYPLRSLSGKWFFLWPYLFFLSLGALFLLHTHKIFWLIRAPLLQAKNVTSAGRLFHLWGLLPLSHAPVHALASVLQEGAQDSPRIRCALWHCGRVRSSYRDNDLGLWHRWRSIDLPPCRSPYSGARSRVGSPFGYHVALDRSPSFPGHWCPLWLRFPVVASQLGSLLGWCWASRLPPPGFHRQLRLLL